MKEVFIISAVRTPLGSFGGILSGFSATELGALAIKGALNKVGLSPSEVDEVFMGNVVSANLGQAPAKQAALGAGISNSVPCTTINKVCASGMKSIMLGAQSIMLGLNDVVVCGGMESMSNIPYYIPKARWGYKYGKGTMIDGLERDGLEDAYSHGAMGVFADQTAEELDISREEQDRFAIQSYERTAKATSDNLFDDEIIPVTVPQRKKDDIIVTADEEYKRVRFDKIPNLRPAFTKDGTATAANSSTINDGASAVILMSRDKIQELGLKAVARIVSFADAAHDPSRFTTAPALAAPIAIKRAGLTRDDIDFYEVNEAFATVTLAFNKAMNISEEKVNVFGGACALGHPLGASGTRIVTTLNNVLHKMNGRYGLATLCNGGGGASAIILEKINE